MRKRRVTPLRFSVNLGRGLWMRARFCPLKALIECDELVQRNPDLRWPEIATVASDVMDGGATSMELWSFWNQKLLTKERHTDYVDQRSMGITWADEDECGKRWTVLFTRRAIKIFWPDRIGGGT